MMSREQIQAVKRLLKKPARSIPSEFIEATDPVAVLVQSYLLWECPAEKALLAFRRIQSEVVDFNELRVCLPQETLEILGPRFPRAEERAMRLRATMNDLYRREHAVSFQRIGSMGKRDAKTYIESLEGIVPFVAARLGLICFAIHGMPVDERLRDALAGQMIVEPQTHPEEVAAALGHVFKAEDCLDAHHQIQAWLERASRSRGRANRVPASKPAAKPAVSRSGSGPDGKSSANRTKRSAAAAGKSQ